MVMVLWCKKNVLLSAAKHLYRFVAAALITKGVEMLHCAQHDVPGFDVLTFKLTQ